MSLTRYATESMVLLARFFRANMARRQVLQWAEACRVRWRVWKVTASGSHSKLWERDRIFEVKLGFGVFW